MMGGVKGSYGRYSVGNRVNNLSPAQFNTMQDIEEQQRRRFRRKREPGFVGTGFWFWNYPNMVGTIGSGTLLPSAEQHQEEVRDNTRAGDTANTVDGMGQGGTAASATGAAGGSPA